MRRNNGSDDDIDILAVGVVLELVVVVPKGRSIRDEHGLTNVVQESIEDSGEAGFTKVKIKKIKNKDGIPKNWTHGIPWSRWLEDNLPDYVIEAIQDKDVTELLKMNIPKMVEETEKQFHEKELKKLERTTRKCPKCGKRCG